MANNKLRRNDQFVSQIGILNTRLFKVYITYASYINIKYNLKQGQVYHTDNSNKVGQMTPAYKLDMFDGK